MQITKCTPSKSHIALDEPFDLSITLKMGSGESLPSTGAGSFVQINGACNNQYEFWNDQPISETLLEIFQGAGKLYGLENVGIASGATKTLTLTGIRFDAQTFQSRISKLPDDGAARAYPYAVMVGGSRLSDFALYSAARDSVGMMLLSRVDPVINGVTMIDIHPLDPLAHFGDYIQGRSLPRIAADVTLDPLDPTLTAVHTLTLTHGGSTIYSASNASGVFEPGVLAVTGAVGWSYTVTDSAGNSASDNGTFEVLPYVAPVITTLRVERYKVVLDDLGDPSYPAADDGELVRFTVSADVSAVEGLNAWTLDIVYGVAESGVTTTVTPLSGTDGGAETIRKIDDRTLLTVAIPASADYDFEVTLSDYFGPVMLRVSVYKAGGYFNVEKFGTGSGMRTTGTPESPCSDFAWPIKAWDDVIDRDGNKIVAPVGYSTERMDTGAKWIDGKTIYRKVYPFGAIAVNAYVEIPIGEVGQINDIVRLRGGAYAGDSTFYTLPDAHYNSFAGQTQIAVYGLDGSAPYMRVRTGSNRALSMGYVVLEYTRPSRNLAYNNAFLNTDGWFFDMHATIDPTRKLGDSRSVKMQVAGLTEDEWRLIRTDASRPVPCAPGETFVASAYVFIDDYTTFQGSDVAVEVEYRSDTTRLAVHDGVMFPVQAHNGRWTRLKTASPIPAPSGTTNCRIKLWVRRNGTCWFACPQLEIGSAVTDWVA